MPTNRPANATGCWPRSGTSRRPSTPPVGRASALIAKNSLTASDAKVVEDAFEQRLSQLGSASETAVSADEDGSVAEAAVVRSELEAEIADKHLAQGIDKSALAVPAPRRYRDRDHLRHVAKQPCLICGRKPSDPHHLRYLQPRALGRKSSDEFVVPLCRIHHRLVHRVGNEAAWWQDAGIDPITAARKLWRETRTDAGRAAPATKEHGIATDQPLTAGGRSADSQPPI